MYEMSTACSVFILDLPQLLLGQRDPKDVAGDQHPLWGTPMKFVVEPPEFGAQTGRFNRFLTSLFPSPKIIVSFSQSLIYALPVFLMVTKTVQECTYSLYEY